MDYVFAVLGFFILIANIAISNQWTLPNTAMTYGVGGAVITLCFLIYNFVILMFNKKNVKTLDMKKIIQTIILIMVSIILAAISIKMWNTECMYHSDGIYSVLDMVKTNQIVSPVNQYTGQELNGEVQVTRPYMVIWAVLSLITGKKATSVCNVIAPIAVIFFAIYSMYKLARCISKNKYEQILIMFAYSVMLLFSSDSSATNKYVGESVSIMSFGYTERTFLVAFMLPYCWISFFNMMVATKKKDLIVAIIRLALVGIMSSLVSAWTGIVVVGIYISMIIYLTIKERKLAYKVRYAIEGVTCTLLIQMLIGIVFSQQLLEYGNLFEYTRGQYLQSLKELWVYLYEGRWYCWVVLAMVCALYFELSEKVCMYSVWVPFIYIPIMFNPISMYVVNLNGMDVKDVLLGICFNGIIAIVFASVVQKISKWYYKAIAVGITCLILGMYGRNYYKLCDGIWTNNYNKVDEQIVMLDNAISEFGQTKTVMAPKDVTFQLRLIDPEIVLFYHEHYADEMKKDEIYQAINKTPPYLMPIGNVARSTGYRYVILESGQIDKNVALQENKLYYLGETQNYELYVVGY